MDRPAIKRFLSLAVLLVTAGAAAPEPGLQAARWTAPDRVAEVLAAEPAECLPPAGDPALDLRLSIGRAAFRSPLLLGGQAARIGLSCNSCHRSGRGNPAFVFLGVSGAPGTADVTSSLLSSHRGDGVFNPKPIPDLSGLKPGLKVDQSIAGQRLEPFIRGQIVEEFDGSEPTRATLDGLASYVRALDPKYCAAPVPITLTRDLARVDEALGAAIALLRQDDPATARVMIAAARSALGLVDERYRTRALRPRTAELRRAAQALGAIERRLPGDPDGAAAALAAWLAAKDNWRIGLRAAEGRSFYNPALLR